MGINKKVRAIIIAGGVGSRFSGHYIPKQFVEVESKPILAFTLENVQSLEFIDEIVLVINKKYEELYKDIIKTYGLASVKYVDGGSTRQESIRKGLEAVSGADFVMIQNGVCPMTSPKLMEKVIRKAIESGTGASSYVEIVDTVVEIENKKIHQYLDRSKLVKLQAPQVFDYQILKECHDKALAEGVEDVTNDADLLMRNGHDIHLVRGSFDNIKVTTTEDWLLAKSVLKGKIRFRND